MAAKAATDINFFIGQSRVIVGRTATSLIRGSVAAAGAGANRLFRWELSQTVNGARINNCIAHPMKKKGRIAAALFD
ncbi:hypothetical protein [Aquabacterium sp. CECT 9606]|uniref:hypothetical protein n=1 Tax=Aquabacterium sp. CECT 9606 TaxID=2845822 RepID=UPI001E2DCBAD|nr:hypothetical protein [Aquabacterium sp. CECT 9606]